MIMMCILMASFSIFLSVPLVLAFVKIKQKKDCMNEEKWNHYFSDLSVKGYKKIIAVLVGLPLILCSFVNYLCLRKKYEEKQAACISSLIFVFFAFVRTMKYFRHSDEINEQIMKIKTQK